MAGRKWEVSDSADASHSFSLEYTVLIKKISNESVERHIVRIALTPGRRPVGICRLLGFQ
jgi:hypothetical protein